MEYEEKVAYAIKDISSRLGKKSHSQSIYPIYFKWLSRLNRKFAPPHFQGFMFNFAVIETITFLCSLLFYPIFCIIVLLYINSISYSDYFLNYKNFISYLKELCIINPIIFSIIFSTIYRRQSNLLKLPPWDKYPEISSMLSYNQNKIIQQIDAINESRFSMKNVAKWVAIIWSLFCLLGIIVGMRNVSKMEDTSPKSEYTETGKTIGVGCGLGMWAGIWLAIAGPATIIYLLSGKKTVIAEVNVESSKTVTLCAECGKYYEGKNNFCPNCGKPIGSIK